MHRLLVRLGHPERKLPPVIHVAGTNGKGSTIAYLRAILEAAGLRVHAYPSPYLVRVNECFRLGRAGGGVFVDDDELRAALEHCEQVNAGAPITIFEIETAAAFSLFAQHPADVVLLEVGLGGRLDATNVIDAALASGIAPVSMDHSEFLGDTLTAIAREKAGIIKRGVPGICAEQPPEAMAAIEAQARRALSRRRGGGCGGRCLAAGGGHRRNDGKKGGKRVSRKLRGPDPPHHRGADSGSRQRNAAGPAGGRRPRARHAGGNFRQRRSGAAFAGALGLRGAAAYPDHGIAISRRPCARGQWYSAQVTSYLKFRWAGAARPINTRHMRA